MHGAREHMNISRLNIFRFSRADRLYPRIAYRRTGVCFAPQLAPPVHADAKQLAPLEAVRRAHSRRVQGASAQHQRRRDHRAGSVQRHKLIGDERRHRCFGREGRWGHARLGGKSAHRATRR